MNTHHMTEQESDQLIAQRPGVGQMAGRVAVGATRGTLKLLAFCLNFFIPGLGTFMIGRFGTAVIQLFLIPIGVLLIPFNGIGFLVLVGNWVWGLLLVVQVWRQRDVIYMRQRRRR
jgi:TM2 domain-containing membrane protein YozV